MLSPERGFDLCLDALDFRVRKCLSLTENYLKRPVQSLLPVPCLVDTVRNFVCDGVELQLRFLKSPLAFGVDFDYCHQN